MTAEPREERAMVAVAALAAGLLIAQQVAARATKDTLFLSAFSIESLPLVMMASAVLALVGAEAMSVALARRSPARAVPAATLLSAALLVAEWGTSLVAPRAAAVLVYLHVATFGGALVSGFWSLVNERFDPYTARRVIGRIGTGAAAGGVIGGALAVLAARWVPVAAALLGLAALHAAAALVLGRMGRLPSASAARPSRGTARLALPLLARMTYLRDLALVVALGGIVDALLDFLFKAKAVERFGGGGPLMTVFALFHVGMSLAGLLLQGTLARVALQRLGLAGTVALRPALSAAAAALGAALPRFSTALVARGGHEALTNSLFRSGYELFYTPLPEAEKRRVKAVVDVAVDKGGTLLGSAAAAAVLVVLPARGAERLLFALAAVFALGALALTRRLHRGYVRTLEESLLAGRVRLGPDEVLDRTTELTLASTGFIERGTLLRQIEELRGGASAGPGSPAAGGEAAGASRPGGASRPEPALELVADLRSGRAERIRGAIRARPDPEPLVVAALVPLLAVDEVYADVVRALRRAAPRATGQLVDALLDVRLEPAVRRRIPRVLKACASERSAAGLVAALDDAGFGVRAAAASALAALHERSAVAPLPREAVLAHVRRELRGAAGGERQVAHVFTLLSLTLEAQPLRIAWAALRGSDRTLRGTALEYLSTVLPADLFASLRERVARGENAPPGPRRTAEQVAEELRVSSVGLRLEGVPWRKGREAKG
jgi:AAA family ATP:ADP antiporter